MYLTRQDHIDRQVSAVYPCSYHSQHPREIMVVFTNGEWACSSGHVSNNDLLPYLRTPDKDPVAWIQANAEKLARDLPVKLCSAHEDGDEEVVWGQEGHLWGNGREKILTLCLPQAHRFNGRFTNW